MSSIFKLAASTALAGAMAVAAAAQSETSSAGAAFVEAPGVGDTYASDLIGADVVTPDLGAGGPAWNVVGTVDDVLIGDDGMVRAILIDVGGALGIGGKTVALPVSAIDIGRETLDAPLRVGVDLSRQALEAAPVFDAGGTDRTLDERAERAGQRVGAAASDARAVIEDGAASVGEALSEGAEAIGQATDRAADSPGSSDPAGDDDGRMATAGRNTTAYFDRIEGAEVRDSFDYNIGSVAEIVDGPDGRLAVLSIGGVFGIGAHRVALPLDDLSVRRDIDADEVTVHVSASEDELRAMPAYGG